MNVHTKREKEFVKLLLELLKKRGVLLLKRSEIPEFVESRRPPKINQAEKLQGHRLGLLNADMRLLFAIAKHFEKEFRLVYGERNVPDDWREAVRGLSSYEIGSLCGDAFWLLVKERFGEKVDIRTHGYLLQPDWSILVVNRTSDFPWPNHPKLLLSRLEGQLIMHNVSTF